MRAVVKRSFLDLKEKREREPGEVFELTEERFVEINRKLNGYLVETDEEPAAKPAAKKPARRKTASKAKEPENK